MTRKALTIYNLQCKEGDPSRMRVLLKYKQDLFLRNGLLYQKVKLKNHDSVINQFVLPKTPRRRATLALHDNYGHLGMEKTLGLLPRVVLLAQNDRGCQKSY